MITIFKSSKLTIKAWTSHRLFSYKKWTVGMRLSPDNNTKGINIFFLGLVIGFTLIKE